MKKLFNVGFIATLLLIYTTSCTNAQSRISENVGPFSGIKVSTGITAYLSQGSSERVDIEASERDLEDLVVETKGNVLHIYYDNSNWKIFRSRNAKVYIQAVNIASIKASSGADIIGESLLKGDEMTISSSSGAQVKVEVEARSLDLDTSSGSDIVISGTADAASGSASSGADLRGQNLTVRSADLNASSGADIRMGVTESLKARASSGADIVVSGNPRERNTDTSSGGSVRVN